MEVPRRLYTTETGEICEEGDPRARFLLSAKGGVMTEAEAQRVGLLDYLAKAKPVEPLQTSETPEEAPAVKMVEQATVEDKAVDGPTDVKGAVEEPATEPATMPEPEPQEPRRTGGGRRGA